MSMYLEFEPKYWYMGFAIQQRYYGKPFVSINEPKYIAYTDNGNTYNIDTLKADTLKELKAQIRQYHIKAKNGYGERIAIRALKGGK